MSDVRSAPTLISIIIPVLDNPTGLAKTIESMARIEDDAFEVIVVDDGSAEPLPDTLASSVINCKIVRLEVNHGTGAARNIGVEASAGSILAFTDSDCVVPPGWLRVIREAMEDRSIEAVAGAFGDYPQPNAVTWLHFLEVTYYRDPEKEFINCFNTNNFAIRREMFGRIGGFPDMTIGEDLILGYKLFKAGVDVRSLNHLLIEESFRPTAARYFVQQFKRSSAVLEIYLQTPEVYFMKWPVKRSTLHLQLVALMAMLLTPVAGFGLGFSFFCFMVLVMMNGSFLAYAWRKTDLPMTIKVLLLALLVRNTAWLSGMAWVTARRPNLLFSGVGRLLRYLRDSRA